MTPGPLPSSSPAEQGVAAGHLLRFLDGVEEAEGVELHSLMILRHGHVVADGWWAPYQPDLVHHLYSLSKGFTSAAIGLAEAEGWLALDDPVIKYFPDLDAEITDPRSRSILIRHLLIMANGHDVGTWSQTFDVDPSDPVRGFLLMVPDSDPGTVFTYDESCSYTLGAIVQQTTGQTLTEFLRPRLLDPLGIDRFGWVQVAGRDAGSAGLHATTDAVARLGQLLLQRGHWNGRQLLPESWVAEATRRQISSSGPGPDWQQGYGFQFWMSRHGYRGDGLFGQFCLVLPEHDAVIVATGASSDPPALLDLIWTRLLPAFDTENTRSAVPGPQDAALRDRLAQLQVPPASGRLAPPAHRAEWAGAVFRPAGGTCDAQPDLSMIELAAEQEDWRIIATDYDTRYSLLLHARGWNRAATVAGVPTVISGGWTSDSTLTFAIVFLETPHRLAVTCDLPTRTFRAAWHTAPPGGFDFDELRSPS
ncbi:serine hydrolase domain-containing protein [Microlunatus sp. GCM10028923]|uniref:serine hydrolase domain-containing protein n=1 Tax=Microlunatus sp. GCM10028923 TaxID=3273400 RepID=UPI00361D1B60